MKLLLVAFAAIAAATALPTFEPIETDYHNKIGVPEAERIKAAEAALDFDGSRITGGSHSRVGDFPWLGGLVISLVDGRTSVCGSSLVSNTRAVTAAHCWRTSNTQARQFVVVLGSITLFTGGTRITTSNVEMHQNYNMWSLVNDVAIIRINAVNLSNNIRPVNLASGSNLYVGQWAVAAGFGATSDSQGGIPSNQVMSHVSLQVIANNVCAATYGTGTVVASTLCVATPGGRSTCGGDSGGPLTVSDTLIGITSFGHRDGCQRGHPAGFARVTSFNSWIRARL